jgi:hypothetical protein
MTAAAAKVNGGYRQTTASRERFNKPKQHNNAYTPSLTPTSLAHRQHPPKRIAARADGIVTQEGG